MCILICFRNLFQETVWFEFLEKQVVKRYYLAAEFARQLYGESYYYQIILKKTRWLRQLSNNCPTYFFFCKKYSKFEGLYGAYYAVGF
jgi:hypothetical protein